METIKQKSVGGVRYTLERKKTDKFGKQYEYFIRAGKGQTARTKTFNPKQNYYQKREAMSAFNRIVQGKQESAGRNRSRARGEESETRQRGFGMSLGGGGGAPQMPDFSGGAGGMPMLPGFGMEQKDDDDDDDERGFYIPGL